MRFRPEWLVLLLVVAFLTVMMALSHRDSHKANEVQQRWNMVRSSYRSLPPGYKVLYLTLDSLGYPVRRQLRPYYLLPKRGLLVVADPYKTKIAPVEIRELRDWLAAGNHALILLEYHVGAFLPGDGAEHAYLPEDVPGSPLGAPPTPAEVDAIRRGERAALAPPLAPSFLSAAAPSLTTRTAYRFPHGGAPQLQLDDTHIDTALLYADAAGPVVAYSPVGQGGIVWCASPWSFSNAGIAEGNNLDFVIALAQLQPDAPVIFDEYHHGHGGGMNLWTIAPALTKLGGLQIALALLLLLITLAWRFGPIVLPMEERFSRSRAEYLTSMAGLLERLHATDVVLQRLRQRLLRVLAQRLGQPANSSLRQLVEANARHPLVDQALLVRVCRELEYLEYEPRPDEETMLALARHVERLLALRMAK